MKLNTLILSTLFAAVFLAMTPVPGWTEDRRPLIDVHIHYSHDAWEVFPPEQAIELLKEAGLKKAFISSSNDDGTMKLYAEAPDLVVPVLRPYRRRGEISTWMHDITSLENVQRRFQPGVHQGIGEFHAYGDDIKTDVLRGIIALAKAHDLFLHAHSDAEAVDLIFEQDPGARVLWAHSGFDSPARVREMLSRHKNLWADLAFRSEHADDGKVDPDWRELFEAFPDRMMVGTDTYTPERWPYVVAQSAWTREWMLDLPAELADRIAWKNAEALLASRRGE